MEAMKFGTLWVGRPLSKIEWLSLSSFVHHGHEITLFVYDMSLKTPPGVIKKDANEIISNSEIFIVRESYASFSDMFRYKMINITGLTWTDTDNICLKSDWNFGEYLFASQGGEENYVTNGLLGAPKESKLILDLVSISESFDKTKITWSEIGPPLLERVVHKNSLDNYVQPASLFFPIEYRDWGRFWFPDFAEEVMEKISESYTVQIWNSMVGLGKYRDRNDFAPNSALDILYKIYVDIDPN